MSGVYDTKTLETERQAHRTVHTFVSVVHYAALVILGFYVLVRLCDHGFAWPGVMITIPCAAAVWWLAGIINRGSGIFRQLDRWQQSIFRRQDILNAAKSLKAGEQVFLDFREVTLYEGIVVPKPGGRSIVPSSLQVVVPSEGDAIHAAEQKFFSSTTKTENDLNG
jgi:hypothetical protein